MNQNKNKTVVIIGAGPSGLAGGYELSRNGISVKIFDRDNAIGGLSRTVDFKGYKFDIGPHRFFTKDVMADEFWHETLGKDFLIVPRLSRIVYRNKFFSYPAKTFEVLLNLGPITSAKVLISYFKTKLKYRNYEPKTFEEWMSKNFGQHLFNIFFRVYAEKVWGIPSSQIDADWAAQRVKNLNFWSTLKHALSKKDQNVKSLIEEFHYPKFGAGMMYERLAEKIKHSDGQIYLDHEIVGINHLDGKIISIKTKNAQGQEKEWEVDYLFSSMPITEFAKKLSPAVPKEIMQAAEELYFRSYIAVNLIINKSEVFPDDWIYIQDANIKMARMANYKNFSKSMSKNDKTTPLSCEYFTTENDEIWNLTDKQLISLASDELTKLGFTKSEDITDGFVIREKFAYPTYYIGHKTAFNSLKSYLETIQNLQLIGRGGMYRYNNQDHAVLTGLLAAKNFLGADNDLWRINTESTYLEKK